MGTEENVQRTDADGCHDRSADDGQGHAPCDGQVASVARRLPQLVVGVDLGQHRRELTLFFTSQIICIEC